MKIKSLYQRSANEIYAGGIVQDCSISSALAMEILQSYTKLSTPVSRIYISVSFIYPSPELVPG